MNGSPGSRGHLAAALVLLAPLAACAPGDQPGPVSQGAEPDSLRIVSLSPAISRTLVDFGLADAIVGRTPFCEALDRHVPVVGDLMTLDYELLVRLRPTLVLVQGSAQGSHQTLESVARERGWRLGRFPGLDRVDDIREMISRLPDVLYPDDGPDRREAEEQARMLLRRIDQSLQKPAERSWAGRTLIVEQVTPVVHVFGSGTYLDDVLTRLGAVNAVTDRGWVVLSLEDVVRLDPEAILIVGGSGLGTADPSETAGPLAGLPIKAVRDGRVAFLDHADARLPSSAVSEVAGRMRQVLRELAESGP